jgi:hypothetical protein
MFIPPYSSDDDIILMYVKEKEPSEMYDIDKEIESL